MFSPNNVATPGVLTVAVKAGCSFEVVSSVWPLQHKRALVRCPCAFRLRRLAQTRCRGDLSRNLFVTSCMSDRARCGTARNWDPLCNCLSTLGLSDRSSYGAALILRLLAQPSLSRVRSLLWWCGAHFDNQGDLVQGSWQGCFFLESLRRDLDKRPLIDI